MKEAEEKLTKIFDFLNNHLKDKAFVCGENLTIADLLIFHEAVNL